MYVYVLNNDTTLVYGRAQISAINEEYVKPTTKCYTLVENWTLLFVIYKQSPKANGFSYNQLSQPVIIFNHLRQ